MSPNPGVDNSPEPHELRQVLDWARIEARRHRVSAIEADEVAQETLLKLWKRWDRPSVAQARARGQDRWRAYVMVTARNTYRDLVRGHQRRIARNDRAQGRPVLRLPDRPGLRRPDPAATMVAHDARIILVETLGELPSRQRQIAYLIIVKELTPREIGELLGIEAQTVRMHWRAAIETLREILGEIERI